MVVGLNLLTREAVDAALREFEKLGREAFLQKYGFGEARDYLVQDPVTGAWADSKAIVGSAFGYRYPERGPLRPSDFSGGLASVVRLLRELDFRVASTSESEADGDNNAWSRTEVELVVADYLSMLSLELAGQKYSKAERRRALIPLLNGRSEGSIEFKRRNISAVLIELGCPYIRGYLPAANRQALLLEIVQAQFAADPALDGLARASVDVPAVPVPASNLEQARVSAPERRERAIRESTPIVARAIKRDYLEREARNSALGRAGELFVVDYERWRLAEAGLGQLADRVRHTSLEDGDGLGYDVRSYKTDGTELFIEVKTTGFGELTPFFVTAGEVSFARRESARFSLYRLFDFRSTPRFFELSGPIEAHCTLDPSTYRATIS